MFVLQFWDPIDGVVFGFCIDRPTYFIGMCGGFGRGVCHGVFSCSSPGWRFQKPGFTKGTTHSQRIALQKTFPRFPEGISGPRLAPWLSFGWLVKSCVQGWSWNRLIVVMTSLQNRSKHIGIRRLLHFKDLLAGFALPAHYSIPIREEFVHSFVWVIGMVQPKCESIYQFATENPIERDWNTNFSGVEQHVVPMHLSAW